MKPDFAGAEDDVRGGGSGSRASYSSRDRHVFDFEACEIPGEARRRCDFGLNDEGVFEAWDINDGNNGGKGKQSITRVPNLREYFTDLDFLLGVCSDGPAKSFAFRRLKYLASKWSLFCLLNEYQELADMKVSCSREKY